MSKNKEPEIIGETSSYFQLESLDLTQNINHLTVIDSTDGWKIKCACYKKKLQAYSHKLHTEDNPQLNAMIDLQVRLGSSIAEQSKKYFSIAKLSNKDLKTLIEMQQNYQENLDYIKNIIHETYSELKTLRELRELKMMSKKPKQIEIETKLLAEQMKEQQNEINELAKTTHMISEKIMKFLEGL